VVAQIPSLLGQLMSGAWRSCRQRSRPEAAGRSRANDESASLLCLSSGSRWGVVLLPGDSRTPSIRFHPDARLPQAGRLNHHDEREAA
jgi:hypothetical protein